MNKQILKDNQQKDKNKLLIPQRFSYQIRLSTQNLSPKYYQTKKRYTHHKRNQTNGGQQFNEFSLQRQLYLAQQRNKKYLNTIMMMEDTIEGLEKLNSELIQQQKKHSRQLEQFASNVKNNILSKDKRIQELQQELKKFKMNESYSPDLSLENIAKKNMLTKSLVYSHSGSLIKKLEPNNILQYQHQIIKKHNQEMQIQLQQIKLNLQLKIKEFEQLQKQKLQQNQRKLQIQQNLCFYENIIAEKEQTIRKMSQFNNQICMKLIKENYSDENPKKQSLMMSDMENKQKEMVDLKLQILQKQTALQQIKHNYNQIREQLDQSQKRQAIIKNKIQDQKLTIEKQKQLIENLKNLKLKTQNRNQTKFSQKNMLDFYSTNFLQESNNIDIENILVQLNYWKNKSESLWELLKNIENQKSFEQTTKNQKKSSSRLIYKSSQASPNHYNINKPQSLFKEFKKMSNQQQRIHSLQKAQTFQNTSLEFQQAQNQRTFCQSNANSSKTPKDYLKRHNRIISFDEQKKKIDPKVPKKRFSFKFSEKSDVQQNKPSYKDYTPHQNIAFTRENCNYLKVSNLDRLIN